MPGQTCHNKSAVRKGRLRQRIPPWSPRAHPGRGHDGEQGLMVGMQTAHEEPNGLCSCRPSAWREQEQMEMRPTSPPWVESPQTTRHGQGRVRKARQGKARQSKANLLGGPREGRRGWDTSIKVYCSATFTFKSHRIYDKYTVKHAG